MFRYASEVDVTRPAEEVFAAITDIQRWAEWTDMTEIRQDRPGPIAMGSTGTFRLPGPFKGPIRYELARLEPNRSVTYEMTHPGFTWTAELKVSPNGGGSRLATSGTFRLRGWRRLLEPIIAREVSRGEADELARMKSLLESPVAPSAGVPASGARP
jgi:uncharacterized protein YndB with AHSA1/START domain